MFPPAGVAALQRVRLRGAVDDPLRARLALERALHVVDWQPQGLPPRALLVVRRLAINGRHGLSPRAESGSFAQQVALALRERAAAARRPWLHADAADAEAVCFADEAELAACLWRDWLHEAVANGWWWQSVLGDLPARAWLRRRVLAHGERLVPALALLASRGLALASIAQLDDAEAGVGLHAVAVSHAMPLAGAVSRLPMAAATLVVHSDGSPWCGAAMPSPSLRRLVGLVPELQVVGAGRAARRLLAVALAVQRSPVWARSPAFAAALDALDSAAIAQSELPSFEPSVSRDAAAVDDTLLPPALPAHEAAATSTQERGHVAREAPVTSPTPTRAAGDIRHGRRVAPISHTTVGTKTDGASAMEAGASFQNPAPWSPASAAAPSRLATPAPLHTRYGGLFYVLNIALAWRVYGDFTMPLMRGLPLSPWDLLAWSGQAWFGAAFEHDALSPLLARLAGRDPRRLPGHDFDDAPAWCAEADSLAPWGVVPTLRVHATRRRLRAVHPEGFCVFDVARDATLRPLAQARSLCAEQRLLHGATLRRARLSSVPRHAGARWLHHWRVAVEARLRAALGDDAEGLAARLCCHDGEVRIGEATVDVTLSLAELPLAVRFAGLDRDPGWIPAAGRNLRFHFE